MIDKITKPILITLIVGMSLLGIAGASAFLGPNVKKLKKDRKVLFEQLDQQLKENEELREKIILERIGWVRLVDTLEQKIIIIDDSVINKEEALEENQNRNNAALDSLNNLPDSLHREFLSNEFGIDFD